MSSSFLFPFLFLFFIFFYHPIEMESYVDEIIQEWYTKLRELEEVNQNIKAEGLILKDLRIRFMFIKKYFENKTLSKKQKNFLNVKSSSLTALNVMKEKEMMKIKKAYKEIIELENIEDPFKPKEEKKIKIKINEVQRAGVQKPEVNLEEKLRVIRRPREKNDDNKVKVVNEKRDDEKVVEEKTVEEKGLSVKSDKKVFVKEKAEEKGVNKKLVNVKSDKETVVNEKVDNKMPVKEKVDDEKLVNIKRNDRKRNGEAVAKEAIAKGTVDKDKSHKKTVDKEAVVEESSGTTNEIKSINQPVDDIRPIVKVKEPMDQNGNPVKLNKNEVKNKMKNLLNAFQSKSQKNGDQNKENIPDHSILVEDGEVKLFIVNKKKRVKDYLKETKRKKNKVEQNENEEDVVKREEVNRDEINREEVVSNEVKDLEQTKENTPPEETNTLKEPNAIPNLIRANLNKEVNTLKEAIPFEETNLPKKPSPPKDPTPPQHLNPTTNNPTINKPTTIFDRTSELIKKRILKNKTPEKVYDVGTNRFISESNLKNVNLKNLCRSPLKDGLYKNIIDKERKSKSRIGMNKFIPKTPVPEINSDEEENYSGLITEKEISEKLKNQNHEEIEKYFNSEMSIDIELLFPNIKEISNDSPNKWG